MHDSDPQAHPYEALTPDVVLDAVEAMDFETDGRILALNSYENRVYQVGLENAEPVVVKFYRPGRWSRQQILEEHQFINALHEAELPVVIPLANSLNETLLQHGDFDFAIYERRGGREPDLDSADNLEILGRFLARIHAIGELEPFQFRPGIDVESYFLSSAEFLLTEHFIPEDLQLAYGSLIDDLGPLLQQRIQETPCSTLRLHGDCHRGNILWRDTTPNFVDFDDARSGPAIQDLWMLLSGERPQQQLQIKALLKGYRQFRDFNVAEFNIIETLRTLRIVNYSAWLARRWDDPAFPHNFPWFNTQRYWSQQILTLREQMAAVLEPPLTLPH